MIFYWQLHGCDYSCVHGISGADRFSDMVFRSSDAACSRRHFGSCSVVTILVHHLMSLSEKECHCP